MWANMHLKSNYWDNSVVERCLLNLKMARVRQKGYASYAEAISDVANYIVGFYNSIGLHTKLGNLQPKAVRAA